MQSKLANQFKKRGITIFIFCFSSQDTLKQYIQNFMSSNKPLKVKGYSLEKVIGKGSFGKVYLASTGEAIKEINMDGMPQYLRNSLRTEMDMLAKINHPNVVGLRENFYVGSVAYLVMEYCPEDLRGFLIRRGGRLSESEALGILRQLVEGFRELVNRSIIHRDLKPANILVKENSNYAGSFKLADFGFAKYVEQYDSYMLQSIVGTPLYMAPQILQKRCYSTKCDIWSLGLIFYQMLTGLLPWTGSSEAELLKNIQTRPLLLPKDISDFSKNILVRTLVIEELNRASWDEIFDMFPQWLPRFERDRNRIRRDNSQTSLHSNNSKGKSPVLRKKTTSVTKLVDPMSKQEPVKYIKITQQNKQNYCIPPNYPPLPVPSTIKKPNIPQENQNRIQCPEKLLCEIFENEFKTKFGQYQLKQIVENMRGRKFYTKDQIERVASVLKPFNSEFQACIKKLYKVPPLRL